MYVSVQKNKLTLGSFLEKKIEEFSFSCLNLSRKRSYFNEGHLVGQKESSYPRNIYKLKRPNLAERGDALVYTNLMLRRRLWSVGTLVPLYFEYPLLETKTILLNDCVLSSV